MKTFVSILTIAAVFLVLTGCSTQKHQSALLIQGRTVSDWVGDVEIGLTPDGKNPGLDALVSAGPQAMPNLAHVLLGAESSELRANAAYAMGAIAYRNQDAALVRDAIPALTKAAQHRDSMVRICSVQALAAMGSSASKATPVLLKLTSDENAGVRMCAVEALGRIGLAGPETVQALRVATTDPSGDVQFTAIEALKMIGRPMADPVPLLVQLAKNESVGVRCSAVDALGRFGVTSPEAMAAINLALSDSSFHVRGVARQTLESLQVDHK